MSAKTFSKATINCFSTDKNWLLIYDNANDIEVLRNAWPTHSHGSVIVTTRDKGAAIDPNSQCVCVRSFDENSGSEMLLKDVGVDPDIEANQKHAKDIVRAVGGFTLAICQIASFLRYGGALSSFLKQYQEDLLELDKHTTPMYEYQHTLNTVWNPSIARLSKNAQRFLQFLAYFHPDSIHESIYLHSSLENPDDTVYFLQDVQR